MQKVQTWWYTTRVHCFFRHGFKIIMNKFTTAVYANQCDIRDLKYDNIKMVLWGFLAVGSAEKPKWDMKIK